MNGLTPSVSLLREEIENALFPLRSCSLTIGNTHLYLQIGNSQRAQEELQDIEARIARSAAALARSLAIIEAMRTR